jgi:hypothetical protein
MSITEAGKSNLWLQYRQAFHVFSQSAEMVDSLKTNPNVPRTTIDLALLELERAHLHYNQCRDALAQSLLSGSAGSFEHALSSAAANDTVEHVRQIAELLWEFENKRDGGADEHWYRAEKIVWCATTEATEVASDCLQANRR